MKLAFNLLGADITLIDTTLPILNDEDLTEAKQDYAQAKALGETKAKWEAGNRLFDNGYCWNGKEWYLPGSEE